MTHRFIGVGFLPGIHHEVIRIIKCCFQPGSLRSAYTGPSEEKAIPSRALTESDYMGAAELRLALRRFLRRSEEVARRHKLTPQPSTGRARAAWLARLALRRLVGRVTCPVPGRRARR